MKIKGIAKGPEVLSRLRGNDGNKSPQENSRGCAGLGRLLGLALLLALLPAGCDSKPRQTAGESGRVEQPITSVYAYGIVEARRFSTLSAKFPGKIERILVHEGERVKEGQVLARFEARELTAQVAEEVLKDAEAQLEKARADAERFRNLHSESVVAAADWEQYRLRLASAEARRSEADQHLRMLREGTRPETITVLKKRLALARAQLQRAEAALADSLLTAPYDGVITRKHREEGEALDIGLPVMDIATLDDRYVRAEIDETDIGRLRVGQETRVTADGFPGLELAGRVMEIKRQMGPKQLIPTDPSKIIDYKVLDVEVSLPPDCPYPIKLPVNVRINLQ